MHKISKVGLLAAALSLSALPGIGLAPAAAQVSAPDAANGVGAATQMDNADASSGQPPASDAAAMPELGFALSIPSVVAVGSSMDESAIRDALSGNFLNHVDELSKLTATSITIPQIVLTTTSTSAGVSQTATATYKNLVLSNVKDGIAESVTMDGAESESVGTHFAYGKITYKHWDIARSFALVGLIPGASADFGPILTEYKIEGATFTGQGVDCTVGPWNGLETDARPVTVLLKDVIAAGEAMQKSPDNPPAGTLKTIVTYITDILTAFRTSPTTVGGLDCTVDSEGTKASFGFGDITVGAFGSGTYPSVSMTNFKLDAGPMGSMSLGKVELKAIDLNPPIAAVKADIDTLSSAWFETNARKLIPSFGGFDLSGLKVDFPNPEAPDSRVKVGLDDFDLSLSDYVNGIPTRVTSHTKGLDIPLPDDTTDPQMQMLKSLGLNQVNLNYDLDAAWDRETSTLNIQKLSVSGNDLGSIGVAAVIGNATEQLFDIDPNVQQMAGMGITVKSIKIDVGDAGIADLAMPLIASEQQADPATFRQQMAATAEGASIAMLGSSDAARAVGKALSDFILGAQKNLSVTISSKDPAGLPVPLLMQSQDDPSVLQNAVDITANAH